MGKQYFDVSKIKLDETGRTVLDEKQLNEVSESPQAGAGIWDDIIEWWDTNNGSCVNNFTCGGSTNDRCTNYLCDEGDNLETCFNDFCDTATNVRCTDSQSCNP